LYWADTSQDIEQHLSRFKIQIDLGICAYFTKLSSQVFTHPHLGFINIHPGILPEYAGRLPSLAAVCAHEKQAGVSLHWMNDHLDQGDLIDIRVFPIRYHEGPSEIETRAIQQALVVLQKHWTAICQETLPRFTQNRYTVTPSPRWRMSIIDGSSLQHLWQSIKAYSPYGGMPFQLDHPTSNGYFLCITHAMIDYVDLSETRLDDVHDLSLKTVNHSHEQRAIDHYKLNQNAILNPLFYPYHISICQQDSIAHMFMSKQSDTSHQMYQLKTTLPLRLLCYCKIVYHPQIKAQSTYNQPLISNDLINVTDTYILDNNQKLYPVQEEFKSLFILSL
jgi:hypothetical protein